MKDLIGVAAICRHFGVSESTIMDRIRSGDLPARRNEENVWVVRGKDLVAPKRKAAARAEARAKKAGGGK